MREFEFKERAFIVRRDGPSSVLVSNDFVATASELRMLWLKHKETMLGAARISGKSKNTLNNQLKSVKRRNEELLGFRPSTTELIARANHYELLNELTILGLEVSLPKKRQR